MVTTRRCSVISFTVRVLGTATSMPDCNTGAVIMKITSSTSTTSTMGVMLMSASELLVWPPLLVKATFGLSGNFRYRIARGSRSTDRNLFKRVQQLTAKIVDCRRKNPDPCGELVVSHHSRHGHKESRGGGDERLRDAGSDSPQCGCSGGAQAVERVHYTDHRAEQANKRAGCRDRGQPGKSSLQVGHSLAGGGLRRALQWHQVARRSRAAC